MPVLGPVEHDERLFQKDAARLALLTHRASRNFRNIWYHYPEDFDEFRELIRSTWPGMDIERPEVHRNQEKTILHMFCPEERFPREIYWAGFGFQVWCQMLTYIVRSKKDTLLIIDEPDIYLHSDILRQDEANRYVCGMVVCPDCYVRLIPQALRDAAEIFLPRALQPGRDVTWRSRWTMRQEARRDTVAM